MKITKSLGFAIATYLVSLDSTRGQSGPCFALTENTICGSKLKDAQISTSLFSDSTAFNNYYTQVFNDANIIAASISAGSNCTLAPSNTLGFRYHLTFWCSKAIEESISGGCQQPAGSNFSICSNTCQQASDTLRQALSPSNICPAGTTNPSEVTDVFATTCSNKPSTNCLSAITDDEKFCGISFLTLYIDTNQLMTYRV
jgi:hypothetical protein